MMALLICVGLLILAAGILAGVIANDERRDAKALHDAIVDATCTAKDQLDEVLKDEMGAAMVTARADALGEFLRAMPNVAETERRSKVPFLATVAAVVLMVGATAVIAVDNIGQRDVRHACIEAAAQLPLAATTATTATTLPPDGVTTTTSPTATTNPPTTTTKPPTTPTSPPATKLLAPVADRTSFLGACLKADRDVDKKHDTKMSSKRWPPTSKPQ